MNLTTIKSHLLKRDWGDAITLLEYVAKINPVGLSEWLKSKDTVILMEICEPFRNWSMYDQRLDPMPFDNDVLALDASISHLMTKDNQ